MCSDGGGGLKVYESQSLTTRINIYTYANTRYAAAYLPTIEQHKAKNGERETGTLRGHVTPLLRLQMFRCPRVNCRVIVSHKPLHSNP